MREKELMIYEKPQVEVIQLECEQAVLNGSNPNSGINDLEPDTWN